MEARGISADEDGFIQRYSGSSQCLEENFLSLLLLMHTIPNDVFSYPTQIRDMKLNIPSDLMQSIMKLDLPCGMYACTVYCMLIYVHVHVCV